MSKFQSLIVGVMFGMFVVSTVTAAPFVESRVGFSTGITRDVATGYLWQKSQQPGKTYAANDAYCKALVIDGYTNFRVPTKEELATTPANASGTLLGFNVTGITTSTVSSPGKVWARGYTDVWYQLPLATATNGVRCIVDRPKAVVVPTDGYYKFRVESGNGIVSASINGVKAVTVDTQFEQGEVAIGNLMAGEIISIITNDIGADSIVEEQLPDFPFVQWHYSFTDGAVSLVLYDPMPEPIVCEVTPEDLADAQSQLNLCKDTLAYTEGLLATANGQISLCNSDKAVVDGKLAESVAKVDELNQAVANANAQIASLQEQLAYALAQDCNNGHGNDPGKVDPSNPGKSEK